MSVTYLPGGGLCNQLITIINTFAVAYATQASVQLQPSGYRDSFNTPFFDINWTSIDVSSLLNVEHLRQYWAAVGVEIHDYVIRTEAEDAEPFASKQVEMRMHEQPSRSLLSVANRVYATALTCLADEMDIQPSDRDLSRVVINLGWPSEKIKISSHPNIFSQVLDSVVFAPALEYIAEAILLKLHQLAPHFNGVHLRIENDYVHHPHLDHQGTCDNSLHCLDAQFVPAMQQANFSQELPLFIASAFFTAQPQHQSSVLQKLSPFGSRILHKEALADKGQLEPLNPEQLAVIDFMLMRRTATFVGVIDSTFSKLVARFRVHDGCDIGSNFFARDFDRARVDLS